MIPDLSAQSIRPPDYIYKSVFVAWICILSFILSPFLCIYIYALLTLFYQIGGKREKVFSTLIVTVLSIILAVRPIAGTTWHNINTYHHLNSFFNVLQVSRTYITSNDVLFWYVSYFISKLFPKNDFLYLFIWAAIIISMTLHAYKKLTPKYYMIAFIMFASSLTFYYYPGNSLREGAALGLFLIAIAFAHNGAMWKAILCSIMASLCHPSACVLVPFFLLARWHLIHRRILLVALVGSVLLGPLNILGIIGELFDFSRFYQHKLLVYSTKTSGHYNLDLLRTFSSRQFLFSLFIISNVLFLEKYFMRSFENFSIVINCYIYLFCIQIVFMDSMLMWNRLAGYKVVLQPLFIIFLIDEFKEKRVLLFGCVFVFLVYNMYLLSFVFPNFMDGIGYRIGFLTLSDYVDVVARNF